VLAAQLSVRLVGRGGAPLQAGVQALGVSGSYARGTTSPSAPAELRGFDAGDTVRITTSADTTNSLLQRDVSVERTLVAGTNEVTVEAVTLPHGRVAGRLLDENGAPVDGARITTSVRVGEQQRTFTATPAQTAATPSTCPPGPSRSSSAGAAPARARSRRR
jgi:hypothetical protein